MRIPKVLHDALVTLGLWDEFVRFNQVAQNYQELVQSFEAFKGIAKDRYLELARENHPDHGGDGAVMQAINSARDWLDKVSIVPPPPPMPVFHVRIVGRSTSTTTTCYSGTSTIFTGNF